MGLGWDGVGMGLVWDGVWMGLGWGCDLDWDEIGMEHIYIYVNTCIYNVEDTKLIN